VTLVVDASVALKWYVTGPDSDVARAVFAGEEDVIAPELVVAEVCNASWRLLRRSEIDRTQHGRIAREIADMFSQLLPLRPLTPRASGLAHELDHPVYDCFYLALSEARDAALVTADRRLIGKVAGTPFAARTLHLSEAARR
jgi:predicted nucleic acid-binding protein